MGFQGCTNTLIKLYTENRALEKLFYYHSDSKQPCIPKTLNNHKTWLPLQLINSIKQSVWDSECCGAQIQVKTIVLWSQVQVVIVKGWPNPWGWKIVYESKGWNYRTQQQRGKVHENFCLSSDGRVLLLSNVGATGLNLDIKNILVIIVSSLFYFHCLTNNIDIGQDTL